MDQPNVNIMHCKLLDMERYYDWEILYHPSKANMVPNALSRRVTSALIRGVCLRMIVVAVVLEKIIGAHVDEIMQSRRRIVRVRGFLSSISI